MKVYFIREKLDKRGSLTHAIQRLAGLEDKPLMYIAEHEAKIDKARDVGELLKLHFSIEDLLNKEKEP